MPSKNSIKIYVKDGVYHVYNRGAGKQIIFRDEQDYKVFLYYLKSYLTPLEQQTNPPYNIDGRFSEFTLCKEILLLCFCLMPNHFHLIVQQLNERAMVELMQRLISAYVKYFNKKYNRLGEGSLFQGRYKAALIRRESHFLYLPYYIHHNPDNLYKHDKDAVKKVQNYSWSSYADYLGKRNTICVYKKGLINQFIESERQKFSIEESRKILGPIALD